MLVSLMTVLNGSYHRFHYGFIELFRSSLVKEWKRTSHGGTMVRFSIVTREKFGLKVTRVWFLIM